MYSGKTMLALCVSCVLAAGSQARTVFDFSNGAKDWSIDNYQSKISFGTTNINGVSGFSAYVPGTRVKPEKGKRPKVPETAWGMRGPKVDVSPGGGFSLTIRFHTTFDLRTVSGGDTQSSYIAYFDKDGAELPDYVPFVFGPESNDWQTVRIYGRIPAGAAKLRLHIGFDVPNIGPGESFTVTKAAFDWYPAGPSAGCRATLRDDGGVLLGGKPFFPIGVYGVRECDANDNDMRTAMRKLKEAGVNLVHTYYVSRNGTLRKFMDAAHEYGLKTWVPAGDSNKEFLEANILIDRGHPSILAWYLGDDTGLHMTPAELFRRHEICRTLDPDRLTVQSDFLHGKRSSRYLDYVNLTDVFLPQVYTVFSEKETGHEVGAIVSDLRTVKSCARLKGAPDKCFWPVVQYFKGWSAWKRFPTKRELRAMTFATIVNGGRGVTYFTYADSKVMRADGWCGFGTVHTPEHWKTFTSVTRELAALHDHLAARDAAVQPVVRIVSGPERDAGGNRSVQCLLKETGLFMAVNSSDKDVSVKVGVPGRRFMRTLKLEPYGVAVLRRFGR